MGLHLQLHQEVPQSSRLRAAGPRRGDDDHALPGLLRGAADRHLPPPRHPRHGRHGGADPHQERSGGERARRWRACARTNCARCGRATTEPGWRIPAWCRWPSTCSTRTCAFPNQLDRLTPPSGDAADLLSHRADASREAVWRSTWTSGLQYLARVAGRQRLRADLQPDGGRRHGRDLPRAGVAMAAARGRARGRPRYDSGPGARAFRDQHREMLRGRFPEPARTPPRSSTKR